MNVRSLLATAWAAAADFAHSVKELAEQVIGRQPETPDFREAFAQSVKPQYRNRAQRRYLLRRALRPGSKQARRLRANMAFRYAV